MNNLRRTLITGFCVASLTMAFAQVGNTAALAPIFTGTTATGGSINLEQFRGKYVVLEWWNYQCPIVRRHYDGGGMQSLQKELVGKDVVWITICSSAPGKQGHVEGEKAIAQMKTEKSAPSFVVLDPAGEIGRMYAAKTTPHMFLISPTGAKLYDGAIDSNRTGRQSDSEVVNYVSQAYAEAVAGQRISVPTSQPYGCSVKY